jgi:hypothetical protein
MPAIPVIEKYIYDPNVEPRPCQGSDPAAHHLRHSVEVILHDENGQERFLCKMHAAIALAHNHVLLARAVVDLYVS